MTMPTIVETDRLRMSYISEEDASFLVELFNSPGWLEFIGDKQIRDEKACLTWIRDKVANYLNEFGFTTMTMRLKTGVPIGVVSLVKRAELDSIDIGYALLPQYEGNGYAKEGTNAGLGFAHSALGYERVLAIVQEDNPRSISLLDKLGFAPDGRVEVKGEELLLYAHTQ